jgi:plasmid stabilization system protein ParE
MLEKLQVKWTAPARADLFEIIDYIAQDQRAAAVNIMHKLESVARRLAVFPQRGRVVPELAKYGYLRYREIMFTPWRIIYKIAQKTVYILSVLDSRRNIEDIILKKIVLQPLV